LGKRSFCRRRTRINTAIRKVRQALGDDPEQPKFVQTVQKKGYRFIADVKKVEAAQKTAAKVEAIAEVQTPKKAKSENGK